MTDREVEKFAADVDATARRKHDARLRGRRGAWFGLGMFGLVGWSVAIPTLAGVALGVWMDGRRTDGSISWTLTWLFAGLTLGCLNAAWWVRRERRGGGNE